VAGAICFTLLAQTKTSAPIATDRDKKIAALQVFPKDDLWNKDISKDPVDPASDAIIAKIGSNKPVHPDWGTTWGIPFQFIDAKTPRVTPKFEYADQSDKGPYPVPEKPLIEGITDPTSATEGDRHMICIDLENKKLYELFACYLKSGQWQCGSGAIFDLSKVSYGQRPKGWTSVDAAGLPVFAGLVRYDEVAIKKEVTHALRFTVVNSRRAYVPPASHFASSKTDASLPPMGMRVRLKASFDISKYPADAQVILKGLKTYGMILADNGSDWFITGAPDPRWNDDNMNTLKKVKGSDFEVVKMGPMTTS
ncbi:MAG TPA: hypothetical protein VHM90_20000, partial [Phycisphaerae bacterium]|nr:hypothetical protein [Phycisphaerae bacterium]